MTALKPGVQAPDFSLSTTPDQKVSLSDFRGQPVVLVFYPADWSPVCSDQLALYNELKPNFPSLKRKSSASRSTASGAISPSAKTANCRFHSWRILSLKAQWPVSTAFTERKTVSRSERCLSSMPKASFVGVTSLRWASIQVPTEY